MKRLPSLFFVAVMVFGYSPRNTSTHTGVKEFQQRGARYITEEKTAALWSDNLLRVPDEIQAVAKKIQAEESI